MPSKRGRPEPRRVGGPPVEQLGGVQAVREALRARRRRLLRLRLRARRSGRRPELAEIVTRASELGLVVQEVAPRDFDLLAPAGTRSQGVLLEAGPLPTLPILELAGLGPKPRWLVALDGVEDPQNLGAVARAAEAAGARGLVVPARRAAPLSPAASRASAGALELLPVAVAGNLVHALESLKEQGFWVFGADGERGEDVFAAPARRFEGDLVLVLGAEERGLRPGVRARVDHLVRIPMEGRVGSLNVAAAAAVLLFEWRRRARLAGAG